MTRVVMLSPGYPAEMALFTQALGAVGAEVIGVGDQPAHDLPRPARKGLRHYEQVSLADEREVVARVRTLSQQVRVDRVECLWEPYMVLAARLREMLGAPGLGVQQTLPFRDKERMKQVLDAAGIRTPHHYAATTVAEVWRAAEHIGFPIIVKPIDGAGSMDTFRVQSAEELSQVLPLLRHVPRVSVEEFVDGEEFTYDTVCAGGRILFENICWYRPRPLVTKEHEWVSPITMALRDIDADHLQGGRAMGRKVLDALGFRDGFTHMEWYRGADGEVVFGEIGARPPGARTVDVMNYATDNDLYVRWAEAVVHGRFSEPVDHRFNAASIFKRASGVGNITGISGLEHLMAEYGEHIALVDLLPMGAPRRDWRAVIVSDGMIIVRHHDLGRTIEMADRFASELQLQAG
ncbi:MAG: ATP-grasp domain-containing protein [Nitriliruptorales bacterium]|nr:ATP-grasp domain-containing protein [Nitriliruptorales bacterium]